MSGLICRTQGGLKRLRLNRPEKKNALTSEMYDALAVELDSAGGDSQVRAVLIEGAGEDFCAGNDIGDFVAGAMTLGEAPLESLPVFRFLKALVYLRRPLIVAARGRAIGVGATLMLHADCVVLAEDARLGLPFLQLGLVPEAGSTRILPQRIGHIRAFDWFTRGTPITAATAYEWGLATVVVPAEDIEAEAQRRFDALFALPPEALEATRCLMRDPDVVWRAVVREGDVFRQRLTSVEARSAFATFLARGDKKG